MQAGDKIYEAVDSITQNGCSLVTRTVEQITTADGGTALVPGKRHRCAIGKGDFRVDPNDPDSDLDYAAYQTKLEELIDKVAPAAKHQAKIEAARAKIADLHGKIQLGKDKIDQLKAERDSLHDAVNDAAAQIATLNDRIAELEGMLNDGS